MPTISGITKDAAGQPCQAVVRAYRRSDGKFIGETISNATTGAYSITTLDTSPHVVVRFNASATAGDSLISSVAALLHLTSGIQDVKGHSFSSGGALSFVSDGGSFHGTAASFNGSSYATATSADFGVGTKDFCFEARVKCSFGSVKTIVDCRTSDSAMPWLLGITSGGLLRTYDGTLRSGGALTSGAWNHVALVRSSGVCTAYANGSVGHSWTNAGDFGSSRPMYIGSNQAGYAELYSGLMEEVRLTIGSPRYTQAFTPPSSVFSDVANVIGIPTENAQVFDYVTPV